jgi:hypothetical protein
VRLARKSVGGRVFGKRPRRAVREVVDGVAQGVRKRGSRSVPRRDRRRDLLGEPRDEVRAIEGSAGFLEDRGHEVLLLERDEDRGDVPERLVEGGDLEVRRVPQVRPDGVEHGMALLVGDDVGALSGLHDLSARGVDVAKEVQGAAIVKGVQVLAVHRYRGKHRTAHPAAGFRQQERPERPSSFEGGRDLPVEKLGGVRLVGPRRRLASLDAEAPGAALGLARSFGGDETLAARGRVVQKDADPRTRCLVHGSSASLSPSRGEAIRPSSSSSSSTSPCGRSAGSPAA